VVCLTQKSLVQKSLVRKSFHYPTLNTVFMVEKVLSEKGFVKSIAELKQNLPRQVNHDTLKIILEYLEDSNKIVFSIKGIIWIFNNNPKLSKAINEGFVV
jgi:ribosomal protein S8